MDFWISALVLWGLLLVLGLQNNLWIDEHSAELLQVKHRRKLRLGALGFSFSLQWILLIVFQWVEGLSLSLFSLGTWSPNCRDLLYILGGLFLVFRGSVDLFWPRPLIPRSKWAQQPKLLPLLISLVLGNAVFSLDAALLATAMDSYEWLSVLLLALAMLVLLAVQERLNQFLIRQISLQTLAHAFVVVLGMGFAAQGMHWFEDLTWLYPMLFFALAVEFLNMRRRHQEQIRRNLEEIE